MNVVCASCSAVNRVPEERAAHHPRCGKCGALDAASLRNWLARH